MTLILRYKIVYVIWLVFVVSFSHHLLRLVCNVTCCVIFIMRLWLIVRSFGATVIMKLNANDDLLSKIFRSSFANALN